MIYPPPQQVDEMKCDVAGCTSLLIGGEWCPIHGTRERPLVTIAEAKKETDMPQNKAVRADDGRRGIPVEELDPETRKKLGLDAILFNSANVLKDLETMTMSEVGRKYNRKNIWGDISNWKKKGLIPADYKPPVKLLPTDKRKNKPIKNIKNPPVRKPKTPPAGNSEKGDSEFPAGTDFKTLFLGYRMAVRDMAGARR